MQVKFLKSYQVKTTTGRDKKGRDTVGGLKYVQGETYDLPPSSARHFINRQVAEAVDPDEGAAAVAAGPGGFEASLPADQRKEAFAETVAQQKKSREDAANPPKVEAEAHAEGHAPQSRAAQMEAEGRAPVNPAKSPMRPK